jgi:hypothetical protein
MSKLRPAHGVHAAALTRSVEFNCILLGRPASFKLILVSSCDTDKSAAKLRQLEGEIRHSCVTAWKGWMSTESHFAIVTHHSGSLLEQVSGTPMQGLISLSTNCASYGTCCRWSLSG